MLVRRRLFKYWLLLNVLKDKKQLKKQKLKLFKKYLVICTFMSAILLLCHQLPYVKQVEQEVQDLILYFGLSSESEDLNRNQIVNPILVAIDDISYQNWQRPTFVPREKIASILNKVTEHNNQETVDKIRFVTLDFDLSVNDKGLVNEALGDSGVLLNQALKDAAKTDALIFATRTFEKTLSSGHGNLASINYDNTKLFVWDKGAYDSTIEHLEQAFYTTTNYKVSADGNRREWRLFELVCKRNKVEWVPSVQLLLSSAQLMQNSLTNTEIAAHLQAQVKQFNNITHQYSCDEINNLDRHFTPLTKFNYMCESAEIKCNTNWVLDKVNGHVLSINGTGSQRFFYKIMPPMKGEKSYIQLQSAQELIDSDWQIPPTSFVYVAGTYTDSSDWHAVPRIKSVSVPGIYLILNSSNTLSEYGQLKPVNHLIKILLLLIAIVFTSYCFAYFSHSKAFLIVSALLMGLLIPLSVVLIRMGIVLEVAAIILALQLFPVILDFISIVFNYQHKKRKKA